MTDDSNGVCLGDGVKDKVIENINENLSDVFDLFLNSFFTIIKDQVQYRTLKKYLVIQK